MDLRKTLADDLLIANYPHALTKLRADFTAQFRTVYNPDNINYIDKTNLIRATGQKNFENMLLQGQFGSIPIFATPLINVDGAFEGGGAKAIAYLGGLHSMAQCGLWFSRVAGTSGGSLIAALIAAGYKVDLNYQINSLISEPVTVPLKASADNSLNKILFEEDFLNVADFDVEDDPLVKNSATAKLLQELLSDSIKKITGTGGIIKKMKEFNISVNSSDVRALLLQNLPAVQPFIDTAVMYLTSLINRYLRDFSRGINDIANTFDSVIVSVAEDALSYLLYDNAISPKHRKVFRACFRIIEKGGFWTGNVVQNLLEKHLQAKIKNPTGPADLTLFPNFKTVAFRDLPFDFCCTATDVGNLDKNFDEDYVVQSRQQIVYFSKKLTPDYSVSEAVRRSISLPIVFYPKKINEGKGFNFPPKLIQFSQFNQNEFLKDPDIARLDKFKAKKSIDMSMHNNNILLDGGFRVNLPISIFRDKENIIFDNNFDSQGNPRNFLFSFNLSDLDVLKQRPDAVPKKVEPEPIEAIFSTLRDVVDGTCTLFRTMPGGSSNIDINTDGIKRVAKALKQTIDYGAVNRQELEIIDLMPLVPKLMPVNIPSKDPNAIKGDDRFSGEAFGMPNIEKKWIAHSAWEAMNDALNKFTINQFKIGVASTIKPYKHGLSVTVQTPQTGALQDTPALFTDNYFSDENFIFDQSNYLNITPAYKILGRTFQAKYYGPGTYWIKTKNAHKTNTADDYLRFEVANPVRVYLILDSIYSQNRSSLPNFIRNNGWSLSNIQLASKDPNMQLPVGGLSKNLFVMQKDFPKGGVTLGGSRSGNGMENRCNYTVLLVQKN